MMRRLLVRAFSSCGVLLLAACETCGPFRAAWYLSEDKDKHTNMYLTLLGEGDRVKISAVVINPETDDLTTGWWYPLAEEMPSGRFIVRPIKAFKMHESGEEISFSGCRVPTRIAVQCEAPRRVSWAQIGGTLPNYLPPTWIDDTRDECPNDAPPNAS